MAESTQSPVSTVPPNGAPLTREQASALLTEHTTSPVLIRHALAVEASMRSMAERMGGDVEYWGAIGLLHDFDYEQHPTAAEHPFAGARILRERGFPEQVIEDILACDVRRRGA